MESSQSYPNEHLQGLNNMRKQGQLCDVTIQVEGKMFHAHKAVLASTGSYFLAMFTSGFKESSATEITVEGSADAFEILLEFAYTGSVSCFHVASCVYEALEMACYMQFTEFAKTCAGAICTLLKNEIDKVLHKAYVPVSVNDVCKVIVLAQRHKYLASLYKGTLGYFAEKVESLKSLKIFLENADVTYLNDLLCQKNLSNAEEENLVLELVIKWLKHDWNKRKVYSHQLLQKVRLGLVDTEDIKKLIGPDILNIPGCSELVNRVLGLKASTEKDMLVAENPDIAATRSTIMVPVMNHDGNMEYFEAESEDPDWRQLDKFAPLPCKKLDAMVVANGILYMAGGENRKKFYMYQSGANKWLQLPSKPLRKKEIKLVSVGAYIFAFGTCTKLKDPVIERYDVNAKKWEVLRKGQEGVQDSRDANTTRYTLVAEVMGATEDDGYCTCWHRVWRDQYISAVLFEGKILVSSLRCVRDMHNRGEERYCLREELTIFDPQTNACQITAKMTERSGEMDENWFEPTLFTHKDQLYHAIAENDTCDHGPVWITRLSVTHDEDGWLKVEEVESFSSEDNRNNFPEMLDRNEFYLQGEVFAYERESMCWNYYFKEFERIVLEPSDLNCFPRYWCKQHCEKARCCSNPFWFAFDKKKLTSNSP